MNPTTKTALISGLALALVVTSALAEDTEGTQRVEVRKACNVMMLSSHDATAGLAAPAHQIMVTSRAVDGGDPTMQVQVMGLTGGEAEMIDVNSLAEGETKTFTTRDGREVVVSRAGEAVTLSVDGKEIQLPSLAHVAVMSAPQGSGATWVSATGETTALDETKDVMVFAAEPTAMLAGAAPFAGSFENLKSLEGLDPEVREKVVAALHEILSSGPGGFTWTMTAPGTDAAGGAPVAPGQHVVVRRVVRQEPSGGANHVE